MLVFHSFMHSFKGGSVGRKSGGCLSTRPGPLSPGAVRVGLVVAVMGGGGGRVPCGQPRGEYGQPPGECSGSLTD